MNTYQPTEYLKLLHGDSAECLRALPDESVHCCVTSPPYLWLRNYQVDGQIGLEETPEQYISKLVEVFREVRRVLRHDGTCWIVIGDTYAGSWGAQSREHAGKHAPNVSAISANQVKASIRKTKTGSIPEGSGLKRKDLIGIPWELAFALRDEGYYLRQDLIWHKPSPLPSSVTDRCTTAHEYIFLLSKSPRYFYDAVAMREPAKYPGDQGFLRGPVKNCDSDHVAWRAKSQMKRKLAGVDSKTAGSEFRNKRSVWTIATEPSKHAHFATYPKKLVRPCILAGTSQHGVCSACLAPWMRQTTKTKVRRKRPNSLTKRTGEDGTGNHCPNDTAGTRIETLGWVPSCECGADVIPATVLDPFSGMGTTGVVATTEGRSYIGIELNQEYLEDSQKRILEACKVDEGSLFAAGSK